MSPDGEIVPTNKATDPVFTFDPIQISCSDDGVTRWSHAETKTDRFLFHIQDIKRYPAAMTAALRTLLAEK